MNKEYKEELNNIIMAKRNELKQRENWLNYNIFAGVGKKSIIIQRKAILHLEIQINTLEYKLQHDL